MEWSEQMKELYSLICASVRLADKAVANHTDGTTTYAYHKGRLDALNYVKALIEEQTGSAIKCE